MNLPSMTNVYFCWPAILHVACFNACNILAKALPATTGWVQFSVFCLQACFFCAKTAFTPTRALQNCCFWFFWKKRTLPSFVFFVSHSSLLILYMLQNTTKKLKSRGVSTAGRWNLLFLSTLYLFSCKIFVSVCGFLFFWFFICEINKLLIGSCSSLDNRY